MDEDSSVAGWSIASCQESATSRDTLQSALFLYPKLVDESLETKRGTGVPTTVAVLHCSPTNSRQDNDPDCAPR
jgi:hypothetical protein